VFNQRIIQAYKQAPWRVQLQWIGALLLVLVVGNVDFRCVSLSDRGSYRSGTEIRDLELEREGLQIRIAILTPSWPISARHPIWNNALKTSATAKRTRDDYRFRVRPRIQRPAGCPPGSPTRK